MRGHHNCCTVAGGSACLTDCTFATVCTLVTTCSIHQSYGDRFPSLQHIISISTGLVISVLSSCVRTMDCPVQLDIFGTSSHLALVTRSDRWQTRLPGTWNHVFCGSINIRLRALICDVCSVERPLHLHEQVAEAHVHMSLDFWGCSDMGIWLKISLSRCRQYVVAFVAAHLTKPTTVAHLVQ